MPGTDVTACATDESASVTELQARVRKLRRLTTVSRALASSTLDLDRVFAEIVDGAVEVIEAADSAILSRYDPHSDKLVIVAAAGFGQALCGVVLDRGAGMSGDAFVGGRLRYHDASSASALLARAPRSTFEIYREAAGGIEHPREGLAAPLVADGRPIGALVIDNLRSAHAFDAFDQEIVEALADQAAVALVNAELYAAQQKARDGLARSLEIHEALTTVVLDGHAIPEIAARLAELLSDPVRICDRFCNILAASVAEDVGRRITGHMLGTPIQHFQRTADVMALAGVTPALVVVPVTGSDEHVGLVVVGPIEGELDELTYAAAGHAAVAVGLSMLKEQEIAESERRLCGDLIEALLVDPTADTIRRASALGLDPAASYGIGIVVQRDREPAGADLQRLRWLRVGIERCIGDRREGIVVERGSQLVVLKRVDREDREARTDELRDWWTSVDQFFATSGWSERLMIVAGPAAPLAQLGTRFDEVREASELLLRMKTHQTLVFTELLGPYYLLLRVAERKDLDRFADRVLEPLETYDRDNGTELVPTLRCYLDANRKLGVTAERLYVHPHSVKYRLQRAREICGVETETPDYWLQIELAMRIRDLVVEPTQR